MTTKLDEEKDDLIRFYEETYNGGKCFTEDAVKAIKKLSMANLFAVEGILSDVRAYERTGKDELTLGAKQETLHHTLGNS